jgi:uncharacterized membrane protein
MKKTILTLGIFSVLLGITLNGCYYDNADDLYPVPLDTTSAVTFSGDVQPFITASCASSPSCHAATSTNPVLETYDQINNHLPRIQQRAIKDKTMPQAGPANQKSLDDLQKWIDEGAQNN